MTESFLPSLNGVTTSVLRAIDTLKSAGHDVLIIAPTSPGPEYRGFPVVVTPRIPLKQFAIGFPNPGLARVIESFRPDVIHVASPFALGGTAIALAHRMGIPSVAVYQTDIAGYMERYGLAALRPMLDKITATIHAPATLTLAPTSTSQNYLTMLGITHTATWGRGVDLDQFHPNKRSSGAAYQLREQWAPAGEIIVGYVGRLAAEKRVERFAELFNRWGNVRFVVVGDGPERRALETRFAGNPVTFTGSLAGDELGHAYAAMDVFLHFGTEETFGQTIQESQAAGVPVVAPAVGGPTHLITDEVNGFLVDPEDSSRLVTVIDRLVTDSELRARMGEAGRRSVLDKSWSANNERLLEHYSRAILLAHDRKRRGILVA